MYVMNDVVHILLGPIVNIGCSYCEKKRSNFGTLELVYFILWFSEWNTMLDYLREIQFFPLTLLNAI